MQFPTRLELIEAFGLEPLQEDATEAYRRYAKRTSDGSIEIEFSFSGVGESFQIVLRCGAHVIVTVSSERTSLIEIYRGNNGAGIRVVFEIEGVQSEALLILEPNIKCHWWTIRTK
jgi:hypothetical protein